MTHDDFLLHYGVKGMKWGIRKQHKFTPTGLRAAHAAKQNRKVDKSFAKWQEQSKRRENAMSSGKAYVDLAMSLDKNKRDKALKTQTKLAKKEYKKNLRSVTLYRKGQVKHEVGSYKSRRHLSDAKKVAKELAKNPKDRKLRKQYNKLMSQHAVERAKARRAPVVAERRSRLKAKVKRGITIGTKTAAATAAIAGLSYGTNALLKSKGVNLNVDPEKLRRVLKNINMVRRYV